MTFACPTFYSRVSNAYFKACVGLFLALGTMLAPVHQVMAQTIGAVGNNGAKELQGVAKLVLAFVALVGVILVFMGIMKLVNLRKSQESAGVAVAFIVCGALCCGIPTLIAVTSTSMFGSDQTTEAFSTLNIN